ncbi:MAG TPA: DUF1289 domain-containing protein [Rhodoblastus sp.]|nr:DUF1289 domain-containing protein [Rhodoblastus sp.]
MSGALRPRAAQSPCTGVCRMDAATDLCVGCGRTLSEIADWGSMSDTERARVRDMLPERMSRLRRERSGSPESGR